MTQEDLSARSGVSVDLIRKLEQGQRGDARISSVHALARALGIRTADLFKGDDMGSGDNDASYLLPLRRLLVPGPAGISGDVEPPQLARLRSMGTEVTRLYHQSRYQDAVRELPSLILAATSATESYSGDEQLEAFRALSHAFTIAGSTLIQLRHEDLACDAIRQSMEAAERAGDEVLRASGARYYTWVFTRQARFDDAEEVSVRMAESIEPSITKSTPRHIAVWGRLLTGASSAAARNNRPDAARDLLTLARTAAVRVSSDRMDYGEYWAAFGPTTVDTIEAENAMTVGDAPLALSLSRGITYTERIPLSNWTRHLLMIAEAQTATKDYTGAAKTLHTIQDMTPEWLKNQRLARRVVRDLLDSVTVRRAKAMGIADLASHLDIRP